jgi:hypothetical protein
MENENENIVNDNINESTENTENTTNESSEVEFDVDAFVNTVEKTTETKEQTTESNKEESFEEKVAENENSDDDSLFSWDNYESNDAEQAEPTEQTEQSNENTEKVNEEVENNSTSDSTESDTSETQNVESEEKSSFNVDDAYKVIAQELGLEANTIDDLKNTLTEIQNENDKLRSQLSNNVENDKISKLQGILSKNNQELVRIDLENSGMSEAEINEAIDIYTDNGLLNIEAKKIRKNIEKAIDREKNLVLESNKNSEAMQQKETQEAIRSLSEHINGVDKMFGFPIAKDEATLLNKREEHIKYITSGDFLGDVTKNNENLTEAAWLWKNKDTILKAISNRGYNKGKSDILNDIGNPSSSEKTRFKDPEGSDNFDPKKFVYGS